MRKLDGRMSLLLAGTVVAGVAAATASGRLQHAEAPAASRAAVPPSSVLALQQAFVTVYRSVSPSVVQIQTPGGLGSGIVFDAKGDIVTNDHVVRGESAFVVTTSTGKRLDARLVGEFPADDLAVIKVSGGGLRPAAFADSGKLEIGDMAIAIGNPLGLSSSVTEGIVSALNRQIPEGNGVTIQDAIQTSAPINPGNSGGALVDISGRVIGIPTLGASSSSTGTTVAGIGFAIPSSVVKDIAGQLIKYGRVVNSHRAYLGVQVGDTGEGVYVGAVTPGGPAAGAGIAVGDVIVAVAGKPTRSNDELSTVLAGLKPGRLVAVRIVGQDMTTRTVRVTLGQLPDS